MLSKKKGLVPVLCPWLLIYISAIIVIFRKFLNAARGQSWRGGNMSGRWHRAFNYHCYFARPVTCYSDPLLAIYHVVYVVLLFTIIWIFKTDFLGQNLFFNYSIYSPFVKLTAHHSTMHHSILYLFYCLSLYLCI